MSYLDYQVSEIQKRFLNEARMKRRKIAVGILRPTDEVVDSLWHAQGYVDLTVIGTQELPGLNCVVTSTSEEASRRLCELVKSGEVEGFCRAQLKDSLTHKLWREMNGKSESSVKTFMSFFAKGNRWFSAVTISNYNGLDLESKRQEIAEGLQYLERELGITPKIAVLNTRRTTGRVGEFGLVEEIAQRCDTVAGEIKEKGYEVHDTYGINYEDAIRDGCTLICPSIGFVGNTWTKGLVYTGGWDWVFSPYFHEGAYYDSSPLNNATYFWPIISCAAWVNRGKGNE